MGILIKLDTTTFSDKNFGIATASITNSYLEYIQSDGLSYISTGFSGYRASWQDVAGTIPEDAPKLVVQFSGTSGDYVFGNISDGNIPFLYYINDTSMNLVGKGAIGGFSVSSGEIQTVEYGSVMSYANGTLIKDNSDMANQYRLNAYDVPIVLFCGNDTSGTHHTSHAKIYDFKAYNGETLVVHLRPYADADGVVCMKDEVSGELFYNQGTGSFIGGNKISG